MKKKTIHFQIIAMLFLEFAVWGAYLTSMGGYLARIGLASSIGLFYSMQGIVSIFMPAIIGIIADKFIQAQKTLAICQGIGGAAMLAAGLYAMGAGNAVQFGPLFALYGVSVAFFMPTIALTNTVSYSLLQSMGEDPDKVYPSLRVFGTIGFIISMLFVNFMPTGIADPDRPGRILSFQESYHQFLASGALSIVLAAFALTLPKCPCKGKGQKGQGFLEASGLKAFSLFKKKDMAIFFIFSMLLGVSLQITNSFANPYISDFRHQPGFEDSFFAQNPNALISLSQVSETLCILLIPWAMKKFRIKGVIMIAMFAWVLRFGFFGLGDPNFPGVILMVLSCVVYGVAFDFFNISGSLYVNKRTESMPGIQASAQGLFMLMTNGIGATLGTLGAQKVVNFFVNDPREAYVQTLKESAGSVRQALENGALSPSTVGDWSIPWFIFAGYALVVAILFTILFKNPDNKGAEA